MPERELRDVVTIEEAQIARLVLVLRPGSAEFSSIAHHVFA
jgi:hypothetical protein